jgi:hypothetical protein
MQPVITGLDGPSRAVFPALPAHAAAPGIGYRAPEEMAPQQGLHEFRPEMRRSDCRQFQAKTLGPVPDDV